MRRIPGGQGRSFLLNIEFWYASEASFTMPAGQTPAYVRVTPASMAVDRVSFIADDARGEPLFLSLRSSRDHAEAAGWKAAGSGLDCLPSRQTDTTWATNAPPLQDARVYSDHVLPKHSR